MFWLTCSVLACVDSWHSWGVFVQHCLWQVWPWRPFFCATQSWLVADGSLARRKFDGSLAVSTLEGALQSQDRSKKIQVLCIPWCTLLEQRRHRSWISRKIQVLWFLNLVQVFLYSCDFDWFWIYLFLFGTQQIACATCFSSRRNSGNPCDGLVLVFLLLVPCAFYVEEPNKMSGHCGFRTRNHIPQASWSTKAWSRTSDLCCSLLDIDWTK